MVELLFPLSIGQAGFLSVPELGGSATNYTWFRCRTGLRVEALSRALARATSTHEALRSRLERDGLEIKQYFDSPADLYPISVVDTSGYEDAEKLAVDFASAQIDPFLELPLRCGVFLISGRAEFVVIGIHHIATDAWSSQLFFESVWTTYAEMDDTSADCAHPSAIGGKFIEYVLDQQSLGTELSELQLRHWKGVFKDYDGLVLPQMDNQLDAQGQSPVGILEFSTAPFDEATSFARRAQVTPGTVLLTAMAVAMGRIRDNDELIVASLYHGRDAAATRSLVGMLTRLLFLRIAFDRETRLGALLRQVLVASLEGIRHSAPPFSLVTMASVLLADESVDSDALLRTLQGPKVIWDCMANFHEPVTPASWPVDAMSQPQAANMRPTVAIPGLLGFLVKCKKTETSWRIEYDRAYYSSSFVHALEEQIQSVLDCFRTENLDSPLVKILGPTS